MDAGLLMPGPQLVPLQSLSRFLASHWLPAPRVTTLLSTKGSAPTAFLRNSAFVYNEYKRDFRGYEGFYLLFLPQFTMKKREQGI